jgi:hypothetical protein
MATAIANWTIFSTRPKKDSAIQHLNKILKREAVRNTHISFIQAILIANGDRSTIHNQLSRTAPNAPKQFNAVGTPHKNRRGKQAR